MVETATAYKCAVCWSASLDRDETVKCEESHSKIENMTIQYVVAKRGDKFPGKMLMKDSDYPDKLAVYILDAIGDPEDFMDWREQELKKNI